MTSKINQLFFSMTMLLSLISVTAHALEATGDILTKEQMHITSTEKSPFDSNCTLLSLGNIANRSYTDSPDLRGWIGDVQYRSIAGIPNGKQSYGGFPFQVTNTKRPGAKDFLYLASPKWIQNSTEATLPVKTDCIAKQLVLLHAAAWTNSGKTLGVIECHFANGHKQIFEVTVGQDASDWYNGREGENARYAYAEGDSKNCGNYLSVFNLDFDHLEQISFRLTAPDGMWMISAATLLKTPRQLPKKEKIHHNLVPGIPPKIESKKEHQGSSYRLIVLGDTHFDADPKVYHHYIESDISQNVILQKEFIRNATMWQERCPRLVTAAASHITQDTPFIIQLGDLIQGDCGDAKIHKKMLTEAFDYFKHKFKNKPFLTVAGNHDIRGIGAFRVYQETMPDLLNQEMRKNFNRTTFYFMQKEDLFLFIDFNAPDLNIIHEAFKKHPDARYKFVITHGAVIPADEKGVEWFTFGDMRRIRSKMRDLLLRNRVIVLSGHVHRLGLAEVKTADGKITQLTVNSVWNEEKLATFRTLFDTPADYGKLQQERFKNPEGDALLSEYRPALTRYWYAEGAGYCILEISSSGVRAQLFGGDSKTPMQTFQLR